MKQKILSAIIAMFAIICVSQPRVSIFAADTKDNAAAVKLPSNYLLYLPGRNNPSDPKADIEANGFIASDSFNAHFSFVSVKNSDNKVLKLNTLDGKNDKFLIPLAGTEKKITLIFKAKGAVVPDRGTPYGIFWALWQRGEYQSILRHNASNQIKGSTGQTSLNPDNVVAGWHEYRLVFDLENDEKAMTATAYIDGKQRHQTLKFEKQETDERYTLKSYLAIGENDGSTNGIGRYPYFLVVKDEDVSGKTLADLGAIAGADLVSNPEVINDPDPASKKPAKKPAGINMTGADASSTDAKYVDPSYISMGTIDLAKLPYSKNSAQKVTARPVLPLNIAKTASAIVDSTGANGAYKTIAEAVNKSNPGSVIYIRPGTYQEKLKITKADISFIGESPVNTIIYGYESDYGSIDGNVLVEVNLAEGGSFNAENITFYNKGAEWNKTWGNVERRSITLATKNVHKAYIKNCIFLGQQDTMYLRSGRQYFENCYIEGEVDFICGGATVLFSGCHIHSLNYKEGGYINAAAPSDTNGAGFNNGYVYRGCLFTVDPTMTSKNIYLGRGAWNGGSGGAPNQAKIVIMNSQIHGQINPRGWTDWDNVSTAAKQFFREYWNTGDGSIQSDTATRKSLSVYTLFTNYSTTEKILGFTPKMPY